MKRVIYFYPKDCCDYTIKDKLRQMGINVIDVRICKYVEIDFYEEGKEVDYEIQQPISLDEIWKVLDEIFMNLKYVNVVDVYYREVEIDEKTSYPTVIVDVYNNDDTNPVYLIYVKDLDEYSWKELKEKIVNKYKSDKLNVCDEDEIYVSFCS